jgi:hypothetical protein
MVSLTKASQNHLRERVGLNGLLKNCETIHENTQSGTKRARKFVLFRVISWIVAFLLLIYFAAELTITFEILGIPE